MKINKKIIRNKEKPIQKYRFIVQTAFALLCVWIGIEFYLFNRYLESGGTVSFYHRPPGVDGFLPISSFMSFYLFITTGEIHYAHPAGLFIFMAIVFVSLVFGKAFCSWLCPVGFISELVGDFGEKIYKKLFKRRIHLSKWIDFPLRSIKYLLLGFLFYSVFFLMSTLTIQAFLDSPYNIVADLKMYYFFADISQTALLILAALFLLSIFIRNFWCRYLCPYGALLGMLSFFSPTKIKRNPISCIDCGLCAKACPSFIKVDKIDTIISDECNTCLNCVDVCPVADTLDLKSVFPGKKKIHKKYVVIGVLVIFMLVTGYGMLSGHWNNHISKQQYLIYHKNMNTYGHPTGTAAIRKFNQEAASNDVDERNKLKTKEN